MAAKTRTLLAWSLWLAALLWVRPLTAGLLVGGAGAALAFPLGYASVGLVLGLRRPGNPIGWLYGASGLVWALTIPFEPWLDPLLRDHRPLALAGQLAVVVRETSWALAIALGLTLPFLLLPNGRLRSRRSRLVVADTVVGVVLLVVGRGLAPGPLTGGPVPVDNPFGLGGWPASWPRRSSSPDWCCTRSACRPPWSASCCGSGPLEGWSASSCAGSLPGPSWP